MKLELQPSKLSNLMLFLGGVQCSIGNFKDMRLINSCLILNHVSYQWKVALPLDLKKSKKRNSKHDYILVKENVL